MLPVNFRFVPEVNDKFLALFQHRWDFLYAEHSQPGVTPNWKSQGRYPLSDRAIREGNFLYGVRFGAETGYALIDVDMGSPYHPRRDRFAVGRIMALLEPLGITSFIPITSSYSGGLHLYLPLSQPEKTWRLAVAIAFLLEQGGFPPADGQLEIYPNVRNYDPALATLYRGHRLPLQAGSYLLDSDWNPVYTTVSAFLDQWNFCMSKNDIQQKFLEETVRKSFTNRFKLSGKAAKFLSDLDLEIETGWTSHGQTNLILGRIALREYIFGHVTSGGEPLEGDRLTAAMVQVAINLPGYKDWCRHQHEIWNRCEDWARCVENSHYWQYRTKKPDRESVSGFGETPGAAAHSQNAGRESVSGFGEAPGATAHSQNAGRESVSENSWNKWQLENARDRLRWAIADQLDRGCLPAGTRDRFLTLTQDYKFSGETLYRHRDLWHPEFIQPVENPPDPPSTLNALPGDCPGGASPGKERTSLLAPTAGNALSEEGYRAFLRGIFERTEGNTLSGETFSDLEGREGIDSG